MIPLGTREVEAYELPEWQFDKVLYIEKTGLEAQLAPYKLGQKYDMAIIYGQGYSVTACRNLLARPEFRDMTIFVLHDADIDGYNIARTLGEETKRMPEYNIDVIELGLTVPQAIEHDLETEAFTRKKKLPSKLVLDDAASVWFTGEEEVVDDKIQYDCTRCELNAFSSNGLAEFIETELQRHGATAKLMPPQEVLAEHVEEVRDKTLTDLIQAEIERMIDIDAVKDQLIADHPGLVGVVDEARVREWFVKAKARDDKKKAKAVEDSKAEVDDDLAASWRSSAEQLVQEDIDATDGLADAVRAQLAEQLAASQDD